MVLARMTARLDSLPVIGEEHVLVGMGRGHDGRKTMNVVHPVRRRRPRRRQRRAPVDRGRPGRVRLIPDGDTDVRHDSVVARRRLLPGLRPQLRRLRRRRRSATCPGITSRLPYLRDLGVDALWITPFYTSPQHDHGYDVADYRGRRPAASARSPTSTSCSAARPRPRPQGRSSTWCPTTPRASTRGSRRRWPPARAARARALPLPRRARDAAAAQPPNNWQLGLRRPGVDRGSRTASGTSTSSTPPSPTSTGATPRSATCSTTCCASGSTAASTASGSTWRTACSRRRACATRSSRRAEEPAAACRATGEERRWSSAPCRDEPMWDQPEVHDVYRRWHGVLAEYDGDRMAVAEAWTQTPESHGPLRPPRRAPARRSTSPGCSRRGRPRRSPTSSAARWPRSRPVGAAPTWVLSNHDVVRHATRYGGGAGRARPGPGRHADDAGAARLGVPLPGRGARARGGRRTAGVPAGPVLAPHRRARARRLPGADPVARRRARRTASARAPGQPWLPHAGRLGTAHRRRAAAGPGLDAGRSTARRCAPGARARGDAGDDVEIVDAAARRAGASRRGDLTVVSTAARARCELPAGEVVRRQRPADGRPAAAGHRGRGSAERGQAFLSRAAL